MKTSKKKRTNILKLFTLLTVLFFYNCSNEIEDGIISEELHLQEDGLSTIPLESSLDFFKTINSNESNKRFKGENTIDLKIDIETLEQVDINDTDAKLNIANATTKFDNLETQVLQIEIDGELQTILLHQFDDDDTAEETPSGERCSSCYSRSFFSTSISGKILSGFRTRNGKVTKSYLGDPGDEIKLPGFSLTFKRNWTYTNYSNTSNHVHKYQFQRSVNNYSSMGMAYAAYYRNKAIKEFEDKIIDKLTGKAKCIFDKMKNSSWGFKNAIKKFDGEFPVAHLKFSIDSNLPNSTNAVTNNSGQHLIEISFNGNTMNQRTILGLVRTFAHETIHAELFRKVRSVNSQISINDFPGIYDYYRRYIKNWQHQQMAAHYRETIANILKEFDSNKHSNQFYTDLAWEGLHGTVAWNNLSNSERTRITNVVKNYKSTGNKNCN